jgi:transposase
MIRLGEAMMILELHRQGLSVTAIARRTGRDPKTVRKYIERGVEMPVYGPRATGRPSKIAPYMEFLRERVTAFPDLTTSRLTREIREMGYTGAYTAVKRYLAAIRPEHDPKPYEVRFETKAGVQGQGDFARFVVEFTDEPGVARIVWLFSLVLGYSRFLFARYVLHQDLQTLLRCHMQAFEMLGGVPIEILYDRMKTAVTGGDDQGHIIYNPSLLALAKHYRFQPRACRPYRAKTKGKVERPFAISARTSSWGDPSAIWRTSTPSSRLARHRRQCAGARNDAARGGRSLRRRAGGTATPSRAPLQCRPEARAAGQPRRARGGRRQLLQRARPDAPDRRDRADAGPGPHHRPRHRRCRASRARRAPAIWHRPAPSHRPTAAARTGPAHDNGRADRRPCAAAVAGGHEAIGASLAMEGRP